MSTGVARIERRRKMKKQNKKNNETLSEEIEKEEKGVDAVWRREGVGLGGGSYAGNATTRDTTEVIVDVRCDSLFT